MKIALVTHRFQPPFIGGVDVYTNRLRLALQRLGHDLCIVAFDPTGTGDMPTITAGSYAGTAVQRISFAFAARPKEAFDTLYDPDMGRVATAVLQAERPDVCVIFNFYTITLAVSEAAYQLGIPTVHIATDFLPVCRRGTMIRWHGRTCTVGESVKTCATCYVSHRHDGRLAAGVLNILPEKSLLTLSRQGQGYTGAHPLRVFNSYWGHLAVMQRRLQRIRPLRPQLTHVLTPTRYTAQTFIANGFSPAQVHLLPFGVDPDDPLAQLQHTPADHIRFLFIGRLQPYKGTHLLIEAFHNLPRPQGATLTIYGTADPDYQPYFEKLKQQMAANDRINFAGAISPTQLWRAFQDADYFILPSTWHENSPLILLDALQSKTPVIASDIGGVVDALHDGDNGLLFPMGDTAALGQCLQRVIDDPSLKTKLQAGAPLPTIETYARQMLALLTNS